MSRKVIPGKHLAKSMVTVNRKTGETKPSNGTMMMLPAKEGTCEWCAVDHLPEQPHNAQSMFYQYRFYNEHGRWPNWLDAMEHCSIDTQAHWKHHLEKMGVDVAGGKVNP
jgi:hypothetical protein